MDLPSSGHVDVSKFAKILEDTTNSYKFLFLLSILDALLVDYTEGESWVTISKTSLAVGMLSHAWYPHVHFRLSFGSQDRVGKVLDSVSAGLQGEKFKFDRDGQDRLLVRLRQVCTPKQISELTRYVPQRLLRPFFATELRALKDAQVNQRMVELARERFEDVRPLYRFDQEMGLEMHPDWVSYLRTHRPIVKGWVCWNWALYMQSRNPNVPAVPCKLFAPLQRASLASQWQFWKQAFQQGQWRCIYTGQDLLTVSPALDHFLPWSFVAHDRPWNLIPVSPSANSSKSDLLPHPSYLDSFYDIQARGLVSARSHYSLKEWSRATESYVADLHVAKEILWADTLDEASLKSTLQKHYQLTLPSLMSLAESTGFQSGWTYVGDPMTSRVQSGCVPECS